MLPCDILSYMHEFELFIFGPQHLQLLHRLEHMIGLALYRQWHGFCRYRSLLVAWDYALLRGMARPLTRCHTWQQMLVQTLCIQR